MHWQLLFVMQIIAQPRVVAVDCDQFVSMLPPVADDATIACESDGMLSVSMQWDIRAAGFRLGRYCGNESEFDVLGEVERQLAKDIRELDSVRGSIENASALLANHDPVSLVPVDYTSKYSGGGYSDAAEFASPFIDTSEYLSSCTPSITPAQQENYVGIRAQLGPHRRLGSLRSYTLESAIHYKLADVVKQYTSGGAIVWDDSQYLFYPHAQEIGTLIRRAVAKIRIVARYELSAVTTGVGAEPVSRGMSLPEDPIHESLPTPEPLPAVVESEDDSDDDDGTWQCPDIDCALSIGDVSYGVGLLTPTFGLARRAFGPSLLGEVELPIAVDCFAALQFSIAAMATLGYHNRYFIGSQEQMFVGMGAGLRGRWWNDWGGDPTGIGLDLRWMYLMRLPISGSDDGGYNSVPFIGASFAQEFVEQDSVNGWEVRAGFLPVIVNGAKGATVLLEFVWYFGGSRSKQLLPAEEEE
ncbi:MAG: hypothetical protein ABIG71_00980 [Candidatus Uhrbacteria bacterium]